MKAQEPKKRADSFSTVLQKKQQPSEYTLPGRDLLSHELSASQSLFPGEEAEEEHPSSPAQIPFTVPTHQFSHISVHAPLRSHVPLFPKLAINQPGDPYEQEADAVAEEVMQAQEPGPRSLSEKPQIARKEGKSQPEPATPGLVAPPVVNDVLASSGQQLDSSTRAFMEPRFGHDFSQIRIHNDTRAAESARAINALAYTVGSNIVFGAGQYTPQTGEGRQLLAHELTHVVQQQSHETPGIQRQEAPPANATSTQTPPTNAAPGTPGNVSMDEIPLNWVKEPGHNDILAVIANGQMLALPAQGSFVTVHIPPGTTLPSQAPPAQAQPTQPVLAVPTVNKESMKVVNVGGRTGFMIDAGSESRVVFPAAMNAIRSALGVDTISGVLITHIHDDHVQSFLTLVRTQNIRPEGIHIPQAFTLNPAAPSSTLARAVAAMRTDPGLRSLGHGPDAHYNFYTPPAAGSVFQYAITQGDVTFDFYGLTTEMNDLATQRGAGQRQPKADTASLLTRATHRPSGLKILFLSDLRGSDLNRFKTGMGEQAYNDMLQGVTVIEGFQHHMGAMESDADREGLVQLIQQTYLRNGSLSVIAQSQERYGGRQFLNRNLMEALRQMGVNVYIASAPQGGQAGSITVSSTGAVTASGGNIESHLGNEEMQQHVRRLSELKETEEVLTRFYPYMKEEAKRPSLEEVQQARRALQEALENFVQTAMGNVQTSAAGRASTTLNNPAQQEAALQRVRTRHPVEEQLSTPTYKDRLEAIKTAGPYVETWTNELTASRTSGRISDKGIEALWELEPERARELVSSSGLPEQEQRRVINQLPGQPLPAGTRAVALVMLVIEVVNDIAPLVQAQQAASFNENVRAGLQDIMWWQNKGVFPSMQGIKRNYLSRNEKTEDPARVQQMINSDDLSYLVLTGIDDKYWDNFTIWASTHIKNYRDWNTFITQSNAVHGKGDSIDELRWSYRTATLESAWVGYNIKERWVESDRLTLILQAAAKEMVRNTEQQIAGAANAPGGSHGQDTVSDPTKYTPTPVYDDKPKASGRKRFRQNASPVLYTVSGQKRCTGYSRDDVFYIFPNEAARQPVPAGYVVVGGADYNTYHEIYITRNRVMMADRDANGQQFTYDRDIEPNTLEVLLAKDSDLEDDNDTKDTK